MPLISVIMGVYNCKDKDLLRESIDSILDQSFGDFEFLICDDGSTDDTLQRLNKIASNDQRIKILSFGENRGLAGALNFCIKNASGKFIARQDDDDISYPDRFKVELKYLQEHPEIEFVGCIADVYDNNGIWGEYTLPENPEKKHFLWNSPFLHPSVLIRKNAFEQAGCYKISWETRRAEDYDLFMRFYSNGIRGYNIQQKLYKYKIENGTRKYRKMKDRTQEAVVRAKGFKALGYGIESLPYILKPIIIGLIPQSIFRKIRKQQF